MITEANKSQDLQGETNSWRPRKINAVIPVLRLAVSRSGKRQCFSSSPNAEIYRCPISKSVKQEEFSLTWGRGQAFGSVQIYN